MKFMKLAAISAAAITVLAACGGGDSPDEGSSFDLSGAPGSLIASPTALTTLTPAAFTAALTQAGAEDLLLVTGAPKCDITFNYFQYGTVGGAGEKTSASGGIMVPGGTDPACTGPRPVLLYAHGTSTDKNKNMASPQDGEAALVAAMFAAQGYIVVAPNYAGYESSTLPYHPYLNLEQQAQDVVDGLTAARKGFAAINASANSKLFVSGYSQGGFVSMAAQRRLQLAGTPVTAGAHLSGPYNLGYFGDIVYSGRVNLGATLFSPLLNTSFQRTYGNIYATPSEMYEETFATGIETLLPPPRQNSCRLHRSTPGAAMKDKLGSIRTDIQRQSGSAVAAAGERSDRRGCAGDWDRCRHLGALARRGLDFLFKGGAVNAFARPSHPVF